MTCVTDQPLLYLLTYIYICICVYILCDLLYTAIGAFYSLIAACSIIIPSLYRINNKIKFIFTTGHVHTYIHICRNSAHTNFTFQSNHATWLANSRSTQVHMQQIHTYVCMHVFVTCTHICICLYHMPKKVAASKMSPLILPSPLK